MPMSLSNMHNAANSFKELSLDGQLNGCIGALDGWLCRIKVPSASDTMNVVSYFSGHYQSYGMNVKVTCDAACWFTSISVLCPGGTGDSKAFAATFVQQYVSLLPRGFYMAADNAYTLSDTLLIPYCGVDKLDPSKDVFNFYLSQLHIWIEQAFGLLVSKWKIFKKPLEVKLFLVGHIVQACARLHNYCINNHDENIPVIVNHNINKTWCMNCCTANKAALIRVKCSLRTESKGTTRQLLIIGHCSCCRSSSQHKNNDRDEQKMRVKIILQNWWTDIGIPGDQ